MAKKNKDTASMRQFTRKDVEDCFQTFWGAAFRASGYSVIISGITWLSAVTPPAWRVDYRIESQTGYCSQDALLLIQCSWTTFPGRQEFDLTSPKQHVLPEGCASIQEEDALLQQRKEAEHVATPLTDFEKV